MEETLSKPSDLLTELSRQELSFHWPERGSTLADLQRILAPKFVEIGASGRQYSRDVALDTLVERHAKPHDDVWEATGFECQQLAPDLYLLIYTLVQSHVRKTRRTTIWRRVEGGWEAVFHQGTLMT